MTSRLKAPARRATDRLYRRLVHQVAAAGLSAHAGADDVLVTDQDLTGLPDTARRYLRFMGVVGRPRDWSFRARFVGEFRQRPGQKFMACEAWQYNTSLVPARVYYMRIDFAGVLPM